MVCRQERLRVCGVNVKHAGKAYSIDLDDTKSLESLKDAVFKVTGVPVDRMKIMIKGTLIKNDADLTRLAIKPVRQQYHKVIPRIAHIVETGAGDNADIRFSTASAVPEARLTVSLKNLYAGLEKTQNAVPPFALLNNLRLLAPQFAEQDSQGNFSQQGRFGAAWEPPSKHGWHTGRRQAHGGGNESKSLNQEIEKTSPSLNRMAQYSQDIQKKAKIMRKVKFPLQLDVSELPVNSAVKQILKERDDRAKLSKRSVGKIDNGQSDEIAVRAEERLRVNRAGGVSHDTYSVLDNPSGMYELWGHYIGWARKESNVPTPSGEEEWFKYDGALLEISDIADVLDDKVSVVKA
ncbi:hypothetical protein CI109_106511 [Kwoniella shandongensis]|uniref:ubiquitinyl hydrolase 1 n=1 Tax=Kwoniella shandongensis TaxID=1734106 RepID=A0AAJ8LNK2_9TREE